MGEHAHIANNKKANAAKGDAAFFMPVIQAKLSVNQPGDRYEQEADAMAERVMGMEDTSSTQPFFKPSHLPVQRKCQHCEDEEKGIQRKEDTCNTPKLSPGNESYINSLNDKGSPLSAAEKNFFEPRMGYDLSGVRLHTGGEAAASAKDVNALAYTHSNHIVFGAGQYRPDTDNGKRLMAHELTHTIQQGGADKGVQKKGIATTPLPAGNTIQRDNDKNAPKPAVGNGSPKKDDAKDDKKPSDDSANKVSADAKPAAGIGFFDYASLRKTFDDLILKMPARYKSAYDKYKETHTDFFIFDLSESRKLASDEMISIWNLSNAFVYKTYSPYKDYTSLSDKGVGLSDSVKIMESLSGVSSTYINLASLVLHRDVSKYLSTDLPDTLKQNLGFIILTGLALQGGVTAINYATNKEVDFVSLLNPVLSTYTEPPAGLNNLYELNNIPDPRWKTPFTLNPGLDLNYTKDNKDAAAPGFNFNLGVNIASIMGKYPDKDADKKNYNGLELYPFYNYSHLYTRDGAEPPAKTDKNFGGVFAGANGVYGLAEAGVTTGPNGVNETYGQGALVLKNLDRLKYLRVGLEGDKRDTSDEARLRLDTAIKFGVIDSDKWQFNVGGSMSTLASTRTANGNIDYGAGLELYHKQQSGDKKDTYATGGEFGFTSRQQDPFDERSQRLLTVKATAVFFGVVRVGLQYDKVSGAGPANMFTPLAPNATLPSSAVAGFVGLDLSRFIDRDEKKKP